jgi:hypothetical protein
MAEILPDWHPLARYGLALLAVLVAVQLGVGLSGSLASLFRDHHHAVQASGNLFKPVHHKKKPPPPSPIANGNFETGFTGWHDSCGGCGQPFLTLDRSRHRFGSASLKIAATSQGQDANYWNSPVRANTVYTFSLWVLQRSGTPVTIRLRADPGGPQYAHQEDFQVPSGTWTRLTMTSFQTRPAVHNLTDLEVINRADGPLTYWIDGVTLKRLKKP